MSDTQHSATTTSQPTTQTTGVFVPIEQSDPMETDWAQIRSRQLSNIAAGAKPLELGVKVPEGSLDYPLMMYNKQRRESRPAKDEKEKQKLAGQGFGEEPFPAEDPNALTREGIQALQEIWTKAGDALKRLVEIAEAQEKKQGAPKHQSDAPEHPPQDAKKK